MKLIKKYMIRHKLPFAAGICFLALEAFADLMQPAFMAHIVDDGVKQANAEQILHYGMIMLGIAFCGAFGAVMRNLFASYTSQTIGMELRSEMYGKVMSLSFENLDHLQPAAVITRLTNDVTQIQDFVNSLMRIMIKAPMTGVGAVLLIILEIPEQIPVMILILLIASGLLFWNMKLGYSKFALVQQYLDRLNTVSREFLSSIRVVKAFRGEDREGEKFKKASSELANGMTSAMQVSAVFGPLLHLTVNFGIVMLLWISGSSKAGEIGRLMASVNYMTQILFSVNMVSVILNRAVRAFASADRVEELLNEIPAQERRKYEKQEGLVAEKPGSIEVCDVSFTYHGAGQESLHQICFQVNPGERIGIIGPTGAGKSTMANLLSRFYDADCGRIFIGGLDVRRWEEKALRKTVAVVPQKALLFTGTILENLRWGKEDASLDEIRQAAKIACADEFVMKLEEQYNTRISQGGVNFSGGQKQRLALARGLVGNPEILILDDCTSALDAETEAKVLQRLESCSKRMTIILISQRVSAVMRSDRILCLEQGAVSGWGTHEELLKSCSAYQAIYASQIGGDYDEWRNFKS